MDFHSLDVLATNQCEQRHFITRLVARRPASAHLAAVSPSHPRPGEKDGGSRSREDRGGKAGDVNLKEKRGRRDQVSDEGWNERRRAGTVAERRGRTRLKVGSKTKRRGKTERAGCVCTTSVSYDNSGLSQ